MSKNYKKILFHNNKGGVGKTLLTANFAAFLADKGKKVLLIDFDRNRTLTKHFSNTSQEESFKIFVKNETPKIIETDFKNIWIVPGDSKIEPYLSFPSMEASFRRFEKEHFNNFDYIFFDLHPTSTNATNLSYMLADSIILVSDTSLSSVEIAVESVNDWEYTFKESNLPTNVLKGIILNKYNGSKQSILALEYLKTEKEKYLFKTIIPVQDNIAKSISKNEKWMFNVYSFRDEFLKLTDELKEREVL
ncbi:ParA family protein [Mycoplasma capricolum]|uniref:ParA family protein n=2 Tax=Mycoplasmataceae TaxID=2092 RepID=UPI0022F3E569|nr:ParA family protein [Mycoplasma capricolum]WBX36246.1 ParA family protein [Mycoplasma capricolum subsp. capricolum]